MPKVILRLKNLIMKSQCVYFGRANENLASLWLVSGRTESYFTNLENILAEIAKTSSNIIWTPKRNCLYIKRKNCWATNKSHSGHRNHLSWFLPNGGGLQSTEINSMTSKPTQPHFLAFKQVPLLYYHSPKSIPATLYWGWALCLILPAQISTEPQRKQPQKQIWQPRHWHPRSCRKFL